MKKRFILSLTALLLMTSVLCSCISDIEPKTVYLSGAELINNQKAAPAPTAEKSNDEAVLALLGADRGTRSETNSEPAAIQISDSSLHYPDDSADSVPLASAESAEGIVEGADDKSGGAEEPVPVQTEIETYDDPEKYIKRNPSDGALLLPKEQEELAGESLFVGDSVCRGFYAYGVAESSSVYAAGSIGARNLLDETVYYYGKEQDYLTVLKSKAPRYIFLSMGMNDLNMSEADDYCENYKKIIDVSLENSSEDTEIFVCAITPIRVDFCPLERIDEFNAMLKETVNSYTEKVHFIDFTPPLKDENGQMLEKFDSGDGIHLAPEAYFIAMHEIYKRVVK